MKRRSIFAYVAVIGPDEDEPVDPVELAGSGPVAISDLSANDPIVCLGFTCPQSSDKCSTCVHDRALEPNMVDVRDLLLKYGSYAHDPYPPLRPISYRSRHEMESEVYLAAPTSRGMHASIEPSSVELRALQM